MRRCWPLVAGERVRDELMRIIAAPGAWQHVRLLANLDLLPTDPAGVGRADRRQPSPRRTTRTCSIIPAVCWPTSKACSPCLWPASGNAIPAGLRATPRSIAGPEQWAELADAACALCRRPAGASDRLRWPPAALPRSSVVGGLGARLG